MNYRSVLILVLLLAGFAPREADAQSSGSMQASAPRLICNLTVSDDSLFFVNNDFSPNTITVTVTVTNQGNEDADSVYVNLAKDDRFVLAAGETARKQLSKFLLPVGETGTATYILDIATAAPTNMNLDIRAVVTSTRGPNDPNDPNDHCFESVWVEHEKLPDVVCTAQMVTDQITFSDLLNKYQPEPCTYRVTYTNRGEATLLGAEISMIVDPGLSPSGPNVKTLGDIPPGLSADIEFDFIPVNRTTDAWLPINFRIRGRGGYRDYQPPHDIPWHENTCGDTVFVPKANQPQYDVKCWLEPDTIWFIDHDYKPRSFDVVAIARNIGTSDGILPKATISLPPGLRLDEKIYPKEQNVISSVSNQPLLEKTQEWSDTLRWTVIPDMDKRFAAKWRTQDITVIIRDTYGYTGTCTSTINIDSIRQAMFEGFCDCPDSIGVDTIIGRYDNDGVFNVSFTVANVGSDYADSVVANLAYDLSADLDLVAGSAIYPIDSLPGRNLLTGRRDTLSANNTVVFTWQLKARPRAASGYVTLTFTVKDRFGSEHVCTCTIFIPKLDPPNLRGDCRINNIQYFDSLHIDPLTGGYTPPTIVYCAIIRNYGGTRAENVRAVISVQGPVINQASPEQSIAYINPGDSVVFCWTFIPLARTEFGADTDFRVDVTADNQIGIPPIVECQVFIPRMPITAAFVVSCDNVTYYGAASVAIPVSVDNCDGKDIKNIELNLRYDPTIAEFLNKAEPSHSHDGGIYPDNWSAISATTVAPGELRLQFNGPQELSGFGKLFYLYFKPVFGSGADKLNSTTTVIGWPPVNMIDSLIKINDGSIKPVLTAGCLYVSGDCIRPVNATDKYIITQNRPNPFNPTTTIDYYVPEASRVRIEVMDILGRTIQVLVDEVKSEGNHSVQFNSTGLPSGMYYYKMDAPGYSKVMKMMVSK